MTLQYVTIVNEDLGLTSKVKEESVPVWEDLGWKRAEEKPAEAVAPVEEAPAEPVSEDVPGVNPVLDIP